MRNNSAPEGILAIAEIRVHRSEEGIHQPSVQPRIEEELEVGSGGYGL